MNEAQLKEFIRNLILNDPTIRTALTPTISINIDKIRSIVQVMLDDQVQLLDVLKSGDVETMIITTALQLGGIDNVEEHFDTKENKLSNPSTTQRFLTSTTEGVRSWAIPIPQWGNIEGDISAQNDLMLEFQKKEDDLGAPSANGMVLASNTDKTRFWHTLITEWGTITGDIQTQADLLALLAEKEDGLQNPTTDGMVLASTTAGVRSWYDIVISWGELQGDLTAQSDLVAEFLKHFLKTEHLEESAGAEDHGKPVVLNAQGKLDPSMVVGVDFNPRGEFTPTAGAEYPDEAGSEVFDVWRISGLTQAGYVYLTGTLIGRTAQNDDILLYLGASQWSLLQFSGDTTTFYVLDGTRAITASFNAGNQTISLMANGIEDDDGATVGQMNTALALKADLTALTSHTGNTANPHGTTKSHVGLGNADNTSDADKPISSATATALAGKAESVHTHTKDQVGLSNVDNTSDADKPISSATATALAGKADNGDLTSHTGNTNNPHGTTKSHVGLGNCDNTSDSAKPVSSATQTALNGKSDTGHTHTKAQVGLPNVDNTSDSQKPISVATQNALDLKLNKSGDTMTGNLEAPSITIGGEEVALKTDKGLATAWGVFNGATGDTIHSYNLNGSTQDGSTFTLTFDEAMDYTHYPIISSVRATSTGDLIKVSGGAAPTVNGFDLYTYNSIDNLAGSAMFIYVTVFGGKNI